MAEFLNTKKDNLTDCYTKDDLVPFLEKLIAESKAKNRPFSILLFDIDHFKSYNDKYGHLFGDQVLKYFSSSLKLSFWYAEIVPFRFGGDEFIIVFPEKDAEETFLVSVRLKNNMRNRPFLLDGNEFHIYFSGGIASYPHDGKTAEHLIENADKAMYCSKRYGRNRITQHRKIWQVRLAHSVFIMLFILAAASFFVIKYYNSPNMFKDMKAAVVNFFAFKNIEQKPNLTPTPGLKPGPSPKTLAEALEVVHLKSGGILQGKIFYEDDNEIMLKVQLEDGEGSMVVKIKKPDILKIDRDLEIKE